MDADTVHAGNEVECVTAVLAFGEAIPDILADTDPKLGRVVAFVNRAGTIQAVSAPFELIPKLVVREHLLHGDGCFDGSEVNELGFGHGITDPDEIHTMVARSRTAAVGAKSGLSGAIDSSVDLMTSFNFGDTRDEHSAQFTRRVQTVLGYYSAVRANFETQ